MKKPNKFKMMLLSWVCIYPLISLIFFTIMPYITAWHPLLKTLLVTIILVPLMGISVASLQKKVGDWLYR